MWPLDKDIIKYQKIVKAYILKRSNNSLHEEDALWIADGAIVGSFVRFQKQGRLGTGSANPSKEEDWIRLSKWIARSDFINEFNDKKRYEELVQERTEIVFKELMKPATKIDVAAETKNFANWLEVWAEENQRRIIASSLIRAISLHLRSAGKQPSAAKVAREIRKNEIDNCEGAENKIKKSQNISAWGSRVFSSVKAQYKAYLEKNDS